MRPAPKARSRATAAASSRASIASGYDNHRDSYGGHSGARASAREPGTDEHRRCRWENLWSWVPGSLAPLGPRDDELIARCEMNIINIDYDGLIPNNVELNRDTRVKKALEKWHPGYVDWWHDMGPQGFQQALVYLRTAVSVDPKGWAKFDYVRMPEYKWGILLAPQEQNRKVNFGQHLGE